MATVEGNLEALTKAILGEARAEVEEIRSEARSKSNAIRKQAQDAAEMERRAILEQANQEARRLASQATATAQLKARSLALEHRERLLENVFEGAAQRLRAVPQRKDYGTLVLKLAREALTQLHSDSAVLRADDQTLKALGGGNLDGLGKEMGIQVALGETLKAGTGVIAQT